MNSDAAVAVYELQRGEFEAITEIPPQNYFVIGIGRKQELLASGINAALERLCPSS